MPKSSQEVQVIEQVEVESQDLPKTCNFAEYGKSRASAQELDSGSETDVDDVDKNSTKSGDQSVNLLEDD